MTAANTAISVQSDATFTFGDLTLDAQSSLGGNGTLPGDVINSGRTQPDNGSIGSLTIDGDFVQTADGVLELDIGGPTAVDLDQFIVVGAAEFAGTLRLQRQNDYSPNEGDEITVGTFGSVTGAFDNIEGADAGNNTQWQPRFEGQNLILTAVFSGGPSVTAFQAGDVSTAGEGAFVDVTFNEPIDIESFTAEDVVVTGPSGPVTILSPEQVAGFATYRIRFAEQDFASGDYSITIGPEVRNVIGNLMNQDGDDVNGEANEDAFVGQFNWPVCRSGTGCRFGRSQLGGLRRNARSPVAGVQFGGRDSSRELGGPGSGCQPTKCSTTMTFY